MANVVTSPIFIEPNVSLEMNVSKLDSENTQPEVEISEVEYEINGDVRDAHGSSRDNIFFDALGVQFHFDVFMWQLAAHLFLPLYPFMVNYHGQINLKSAFNNFGSWVSPIMAWLMIASYIAEKNRPEVNGAFLIPLVYFLQHRFVIAMKYASMSRTEYKRFIECTNPKLCEFYLFQVQLLQGWYMGNPRVYRFELASASARIGARINDVNFIIADPNTSPSAKNQLHCWNSFLRNKASIDFSTPVCRRLRALPDRSYVLSVYDYCEALLKHSFSDESNVAIQTFMQRLMVFFSLVNAAIPFAVLCYNYKAPSNPSTNAWLFFFYLSSTFLNLAYTWLFYTLLFIAVTDALRQKCIVSNMHNMIRLTDIMLDAEVGGSGSGAVTEEDMARAARRVQEVLNIGPSFACTGTEQSEHNDDDAADTRRKSAALPHPHPLKADAQAGGRRSSSHGRGQGGNMRGSVLGDHLYSDKDTTQLLPRIDFSESHNVVAWTHARVVMQNFGERFHFRLELYVIAAFAMLVLMMGLGLLNLGMAPDRLALFLTPWFLQTLLSVSMCIFFLMVIMETGSSVNSILASQSETMTCHMLKLKRKIEHFNIKLANLLRAQQHRVDTGKVELATMEAEAAEAAEAEEAQISTLNSEIEKLSDASDQLQDMMDVVQTNTEFKPYKVFGFTAQSSLTYSILTSAISFYGIVITLLTSNETTSVTEL
jgi:hypothetical protein